MLHYCVNQLSSRGAHLSVDCCIYCICSWMVLSVYVMSGRVRLRERDSGWCGPHCSNISKFADASSACQAWDSSGSRISHTYMPHSQTAWHSSCRHTYCRTHTHAHTVLYNIGTHHMRRRDSDTQRRVVVTWPAPCCYGDSHIFLTMSVTCGVVPHCSISPSTQRGRTVPSTTTRVHVSLSSQ